MQGGNNETATWIVIAPTGPGDPLTRPWDLSVGTLSDLTASGGVSNEALTQEHCKSLHFQTRLKGFRFMNSQITKPARGIISYPKADAAVQTIVEQVDSERRSISIIHVHSQAPRLYR